MRTNSNRLLAQGRQTLLPARYLTEGKEVANLQELVLYGLKGVAAYAAHALALGARDPISFAKIHQLLDFLTMPTPTADELLTSARAVGELNYRVMEILDKAHTETFGHPVPSKVRLHAIKGKAILVSGHDLHDLYALLEQTKGLGIQIYTHGEMLPAHGYPKLKAYEHLAGNYGGAWTDQADEFAEFPGAILMTSNCIQEPKVKYKDRIFTSGAVAWPGVLLSWYEQKAVAVLLTLLHLGVHNIRIGPTLPAFLSPGVLSLLHEKFNLMAIGTAEEDLAAMLV